MVDTQGITEAVMLLVPQVVAGRFLEDLEFESDRDLFRSNGYWPKLVLRLSMCDNNREVKCLRAMWPLIHIGVKHDKTEGRRNLGPLGPLVSQVQPLFRAVVQRSEIVCARGLRSRALTEDFFGASPEEIGAFYVNMKKALASQRYARDST